MKHAFNLTPKAKEEGQETAAASPKAESGEGGGGGEGGRSGQEAPPQRGSTQPPALGGGLQLRRPDADEGRCRPPEPLPLPQACTDTLAPLPGRPEAPQTNPAMLRHQPESCASSAGQWCRASRRGGVGLAAG